MGALVNIFLYLVVNYSQKKFSLHKQAADNNG